MSDDLTARIRAALNAKPGAAPDIEAGRLAAILDGTRRPSTLDLALIAVATGMSVDRLTFGDSTRILFSGSRTHDNPADIGRHLDQAADGHEQVTLVHGRCDPRTANADYIARHGTDRVPWDEALEHPEYGPFVGGDWHAHHHALSRGWTIEAHPADWKVYRNAAGPIRNQAMVSRGADVLVAAPHPDPAVPSPGTRDCMSRARKAGIPVIDITAPSEPEGLW